ncbi:insecticidal delta-endotoxin Cry8Ea1 family protein [Paenibacillus paeoniae]|uniref:Pesticidal crystal protein domain-containing protein n=1 Tax=Paenibacillus paeoniae TaxID=2292705 RepID=A0A371PLD3_9BACL|nr:insecticidal delta-endotoxin Cry8Ea1 family protein [Paenibacillus paeoniae]REK76795.1 hypothetical protein DX130_07120 [Paenibacillus paeoniae]
MESCTCTENCTCSDELNEDESDNRNVDVSPGIATEKGIDHSPNTGVVSALDFVSSEDSTLHAEDPKENSIPPISLKSDEELLVLDKPFNDPNNETAALGVTIASYLLKQIGSKLVEKYILGPIFGKLFPNNSAQQLIDTIMNEVRQYVTQQLEEDAYNRAYTDLEALRSRLQAFDEDVALDFSRFYQDSTVSQETINRDIQTYIDATYGDILLKIPGFTQKKYELVLLPLFAQAANLELVFIRDVISNQSKWNLPNPFVQKYKDRLKNRVILHTNHCTSTYETGFGQELARNQGAKKVLNFRKYMILNVLELANLWTFFKFDNLSIRSSANIYHYNNLGNGPVINASNWGFWNRIFHGAPAATLSGAETRYFVGHASFSGGGMSETILGSGICWLTPKYVSRINGGRVGGETLAPRPGKGWTVNLWEHRQANSHFADPTKLPLTDARVFTGGPNPVHQNNLSPDSPEPAAVTVSTDAALFSGNGKSYSLLETVAAAGSNYSLPEYKVTNFSGIVSHPTVATTSTTGIGWELDVPSRDWVNGPVAVFSRPNIQTAFLNGIHREHRTPYNVEERLPMSFNIPPLQYAESRMGSLTKQQLLEQYANNGDSIGFPPSGSNITVQYDLLNAHSTEALSYDLYLRLSSLQTTYMEIREKDGVTGKLLTTRVLNANTSTENSGIIDRGAKWKDFNVGSITLPFGVKRILEIGVGPTTNATDFRLMNITLIRSDTPPLYS